MPRRSSGLPRCTTSSRLRTRSTGRWSVGCGIRFEDEPAKRPWANPLRTRSTVLPCLRVKRTSAAVAAEDPQPLRPRAG